MDHKYTRFLSPSQNGYSPNSSPPIILNVPKRETQLLDEPVIIRPILHLQPRIAETAQNPFRKFEVSRKISQLEDHRDLLILEDL